MSSNETGDLTLSKTDDNGQQPSPEEAGAELNKIRSILFGDAYRELRDDYSQLRIEIEKRFTTLEKSLSDRLDSQIDSVREDAESSHNLLTAKIESESRTHGAGLDALEDKLRESEKRLQESLELLGQEQTEKAGSLNGLIEETAGKIRAEQSAVQQALTERLDHAVSGLSEAKTDRNQLAALFEGIARTLRADSE